MRGANSDFVPAGKRSHYLAVRSDPTTVRGSGTKVPVKPLNTNGDGSVSSAQQFENLVNQFYQDLYRFGFSLTRSEADAADLVQETFYIWANKGHQLRVTDNAKRWLLTTLHREFLRLRRRQQRLSNQPVEEVIEQGSTDDMPSLSGVDIESMLDCLHRIHENYRAPLVLYYLEDFTYKEIADILEVPVGTVQSRIARGKLRLLQLLNGDTVERQKAGSHG